MTQVIIMIVSISIILLFLFNKGSTPEKSIETKAASSNNTNEVEDGDSAGSSEVASLDNHPVATEQELQQIKPLTYAAETLNKTCRSARDNSIEKIQVCNARDGYVQKLKNYGWCRNQDPEIDPDKQWVKCGNGEKNNAEAFKNNAISTSTANLDVKEDSSAESKISSDQEIPKNQDTQHHFYVQIGIFSDESNVKILQDKLSDLGYKSETKIIDTAKGKKIRLHTQEFNDSKEANIALNNIKDAGLTGMVLSQ